MVTFSVLCLVNVNQEQKVCIIILKFIIHSLSLFNSFFLIDAPIDQPIITDWDSIDDGLKFKQCAKERSINSSDPLHQFVVSDDEGTEIDQILSQFSPRERKKILKYAQYLSSLF
jgi:hypothetical protein